MIVLFPEMRGKEIIEQSGLRTLLVQAFLAVAEQELKEREEQKEPEKVLVASCNTHSSQLQ